MNGPSTNVWRGCPATVTLATLVALTYLFQVLSGGDAVLRAVGLIPARFSDPAALSAAEGQAVPAWLTLVTYMFPHMSWRHVAMNLIGLLWFGTLAEPAIGTARFAWGYLASGVVCGACHAVLCPSWAGPLAGASGAICGVLGGFLATQLGRQSPWRWPLFSAELASAMGVALWLLLRHPPAGPDRLCALMWHLIPFLAGWLWVRWTR